ncbi:MAG: trypsin-like peptidase domain-containing protein [Candidatus Riflebacteria bacterium]|nr:trypsin-like peptidase domain-containing protein [Candidatus Riflebacteria bacterium]
MSDIDRTTNDSGTTAWLILDIVLICLIVTWLLYNFQRTHFVRYGGPASFQGSHNPLAVNPTTVARPLDGVTRPTPRVVSFNITLTAISPSIVTVVTGGLQSQGGSGVILHSQGYIVTNFHVVDGASKITVTTGSDQNTRSYIAELVEVNQSWDLAILKINPDPNNPLLPAPLGDSGKALVGNNVLIVGSPFGLSQSASSGIISSENRTISNGNTTFQGLIQTDAPINLGSSGGALVNTEAEVIGINMAIISPTQAFSGVGFAIPIDIVKKLYPQYIEKTKSRLNKDLLNALGPTAMNAAFQFNNLGKKKSWLGVDVLSVDETIIRDYKLSFAHGVFISKVSPDSIAWNAGLRRGDIIYRVNGQLVKDETMLWEILLDAKTDNDVEFTLFRQGLPKFFITFKLDPEIDVPANSINNPVDPNNPININNLNNSVAPVLPN